MIVESQYNKGSKQLDDLFSKTSYGKNFRPSRNLNHAFALFKTFPGFIIERDPSGLWLVSTKDNLITIRGKCLPLIVCEIYSLLVKES
jgi:hypothetical protein